MMRIIWLTLLVGFLGIVSSCKENNQTRVVEEVVLNDSTLTEKTITEINDQIKETPNNPQLYFRRAQLLLEQQLLDEAIKDVGRALQLDSTQANYHLLLADLYLTSNQTRSCRDALLTCIRFDKENVEAHMKLGELYFLVEDFDKAFEYVNKGLRIDTYYARGYYLKGMIYKSLRDTANSISSMYTCIEQDPENYDAHFQLGLLHSGMHDSLALAHYENALTVRPGSIEVMYAKALFLQDHGHPERALLIYDQILQQDSDYYIAYYNKGFVYLELLEEYDSAIREFSTAISYIPDQYFNAYYNRGLAYERKGDKAGAEKDYRASLKIKPDYTLAAKGLERVVDGYYQ